MNNKTCFIVDLDGTLASHKGIRDVFDESKVSLDKELPTCRVIDALRFNGENIIFFSGRTDKCYEDSKVWLSEATNIPKSQIKLYMRKAGDYRSDEIIKKELYDTHIKDKYEVLGVFDDRLKVIRMWESLGLFVFNCNQGNIEF